MQLAGWCPGALLMLHNNILGLEQKLVRNVILAPQKFFVIVGDFGFSRVPFVQDSENSIS